ncbi:regulator of chromosome condensation-like [Amphiura filiformis]|uniref:regulator of chromosome condensation-like n=1 Tax=Amphiura filiformis TaxID=82378 RepID=UPI003B217955
MPPKRKSAGRPPKSQVAVNGAATKKVKVNHPSHCTEPGVVLTVGEGDVGQLGHGDEMLQRMKPRVVADLPMCISVVAGGMHTVCLTTDGEVYTFGCNDEGALGRPITDEDTEPFSPGKVPLADKIIQISAGDSHTAALTDEGKVFLWGTFRDGTGAFGLTSYGQTSKQPLHIRLEAPVIQIASGDDHLCMLTIDGDLLTMGCGEQGQLGRVAEIHAVRGGRKGPAILLEPSRVHCKRIRGRGKPLFDGVWCSSYCTFARTRDGDIYAWGLNNYHHIGLTNREPHYMPNAIESFSNIKVDSVAGGQHHTVLLDTEGKVYSLGRVDYGRLGLGEQTKESNVPALITDLADKHVTSIGCGTSVSLACTKQGEAYAWGMGSSFQLGTGDEDDADTPVLMEGKQLQNRRVIYVGAGGQHTVLLAVDK